MVPMLFAEVEQGRIEYPTPDNMDEWGRLDKPRCDFCAGAWACATPGCGNAMKRGRAADAFAPLTRPLA